MSSPIAKNEREMLIFPFGKTWRLLRVEHIERDRSEREREREREGGATKNEHFQTRIWA